MKFRGFTLIELAVVIIVLGILAATAVPKFLNLQDDAEKATLRSFAGALSSAIDTISARNKLEGQPGHLQFKAPDYPPNGYNISFEFYTPAGILEILHYPTSVTAPFCEAIWNVAIEGMLASRDLNSDATVIATHEFKPDHSRMRCDYKYKDIGSIYYMSGEGDICVQYEGDNIPDTCNI